MKKEEIIEAIIYRMSDPCAGDNEEDIALCDPIELPYATELLAEMRQEDIENANDDEYRMPNAATPELLMEAFNCRVRLARRNVTIERLAETITDHDETALYSNYHHEMVELGYIKEADDINVIPFDFFDEYKFIFDEELTFKDVMTLVKRSDDHFNPNFDYCWYDATNRILHSTDNPFASGVIDATAFATFMVDTPELLQFYRDGYLEQDEIDHVFQYWR